MIQRYSSTVFMRVRAGCNPADTDRRFLVWQPTAKGLLGQSGEERYFNITGGKSNFGRRAGVFACLE